MEALPSILSILAIDLVLSGDNVVVIAMAAHRLPPRQRRFAVLFGGGAAIVQRIVLTAIATFLLTIPGLQAAGGIVLLWIGFKLLKEQEESGTGVTGAVSLRGAILTITIADLVMSTDNVLGVAAAAHGDIPLLMFGLVLSMAILMLGGSLVANLMTRAKWLVYVGAAVIAYTGAEMVLGDNFVHDSGVVPAALEVPIALIVAGVTLAIAYAVHRHHRRLA
jgi:YjbE family integral membrane protein